MAGSLSTKNKAKLRAVGQKRHDDCHLGKAGLSEEFLAFVNQQIDSKELIKLRFDDVEGSMRKEMANDLAEALDAHCVGVTGKTMLLYRPNPNLPLEKRILGA